MRPDLLVRALTGNRASTDPHGDDPALRGRTYAIAFDRVWRACLALAGGALRGWTVTDHDDREGVIGAEVTGRLLGLVDEVTVRVGLDADGQTRVDLESVSRDRKVDLGANRRHVRAFCRALDERLGAGPEAILAPRRRATAEARGPTA